MRRRNNSINWNLKGNFMKRVFIIVLDSFGIGALPDSEAFGDVESVKAVSDLISPVSGVVLEINEELEDSPENLNEDPYGAWIIKVEDVEDTEDLMDAEAYEAFCKEEE